MYNINTMKLQLHKRWEQYGRADKIRFLLISIMQIAFAGAFLIAWYEGSWLTMFVIVVALIIVWLPAVLSNNSNIHIPLEFEFLLNVFIYASIFLGEINGFYTRFWWWDIVLHASSGLALGFIGFLLLYALYQTKHIVLPPSLIALFAFSFALSLGALWEIFEFSMDILFETNMQKNGLVDTMRDIIVDAVGAFVVAVSGYFYVKHQRSGIGIFDYYVQLYSSNNFKKYKKDTV